jgi:hypothetical protein
MPVKSVERQISLPRHWPRRVRSAVVHAVSMANLAFTVTRAHAENQFSARVRRQAENDRLRPEIGLLSEELRTKDARLVAGADGAATPRHAADGTLVEQAAR